MGAVYEGVSELIERRVAIKVLHPEAAGKPDIGERFFHEAWVANQIDHPGLVQVHEQGTLADGTAYLVMERLKGETLEQRLCRGPLDPKDALSQCWQIASALAAAHARDIVHQDIKPGNLMLVPDPLVPGGERVKILDWGIAKLGTGQRAGVAEHHVVIGTPSYMSPEQCRGATEVCPKTDVYALGVILFEMLAGRPPFVAETAIQLQEMHLFQRPPSLAQLVPALPDKVVSLVDALLAKDKNERPTMAELGIALDEQLRALRRTNPSQRTVLAPTLPTSLRPLAIGLLGGALATALAVAVVSKSRQEHHAAAATLVTGPRSQAEPTAGHLGSVRAASPSLIKVEPLHPPTVVVAPLTVPPPDPSPTPPEPPAPADPQAATTSRSRESIPIHRPRSRGDQGVFRIAETSPRTGLPHVSHGHGQAALHRARRLLLHKKYMSALVEARNAIGAGRLAGWGIVGEIACIRGDLAQAREAYRSAAPADQKRIWTACHKNGLSAP